RHRLQCRGGRFGRLRLSGGVEYLQWQQRRRAHRLARADVETGVVRGTADRVADEDSFLQRPAVMRTGRADGERLIAAPNDQRLLAVDLRHFELHKNSERE